MPSNRCVLCVAGALCALVLLASVPSTRGQQPSAPAASIDAREKALSALFAEVWEDRLKHAPEYASSLGDKRYNDQLTDYSAKAVNEGLGREGVHRTPGRN